MRRQVTTATMVIAAVLMTEWPDDPKFVFTPAHTVESCRDAARAYVVGRSLPLYPHPNVRPEVRRYRATRAECYPTDPASAGLKPGWGCIVGYNCNYNNGRRP